eukprot:3976628-Pleurochrysis_carterae.AAC.3
MPLRKLTMWKCRERCELVSSFGLLFTTSFFRPHRARVRICSLRAAVHFPCARVGQVGWLIRRVNGVDVPADRTAIIKATAASMKAGPVKITFQARLYPALNAPQPTRIRIDVVMWIHGYAEPMQHHAHYKLTPSHTLSPPS